jgi:hypothetical protein
MAAGEAVPPPPRACARAATGTQTAAKATALAMPVRAERVNTLPSCQDIEKYQYFVWLCRLTPRLRRGHSDRRDLGRPRTLERHRLELPFGFSLETTLQALKA